jgi:hypothetical protein
MDGCPRGPLEGEGSPGDGHRLGGAFLTSRSITG